MKYWLDIGTFGIEPRENPWFQNGQKWHLKTLDMTDFP